MDTIPAMHHDIVMQLDFLKTFRPQNKISPRLQRDVVFCGSGDSLCSAMLAEAFSNHSVKALDPLDVIKNKKLLHKKRAYFVSISGNTISNVKAAKLGKNTIAITKNPQSRLAKLCGTVISLNYLDSGVLTAGTIGFLASALTCISLVSEIRIDDITRIFDKAKSQKIAPIGKTYFLGNQYTYPIAMYAAAKLGEVLGLDSHYERIEQFLHMGLFSAKPGDTVIIFEQKNPHLAKMILRLAKLGLRVYNPSINSKNKISQVLFYAFVSQLIALNAASKKRIRNCYFITQKKTRAASSDMIY